MAIRLSGGGKNVYSKVVEACRHEQIQKGEHSLSSSEVGASPLCSDIWETSDPTVCGNAPIRSPHGWTERIAR